MTLIATILGSSIAILDSSVVSVALPSIQRSLGGGLAGQHGVGGFGVCSLLCAVAPMIGLLVAFRALQGVAGVGMLMLLGFGVRVHYLTEVLPGILVFSLGLAITVAPLTAAILAGIEESEAGSSSRSAARRSPASRTAKRSRSRSLRASPRSWPSASVSVSAARS